MRSLDDLVFIRDRVLAEIRANPSVRPYLGEASRAQATCREGHPISGLGRQRRCAECHAAWKRQRRAEGAE